MKSTLTVFILCLLTNCALALSAPQHGIISELDWSNSDSFPISQTILVKEENDSESSPKQMLASFHDYLKDQDKSWLRFDRDYPGSIFKITTVWGGLRLHNTSNSDWRLVFENNNLTVRDTTLFIYEGNELLEQASFGNNYRFSDRKIKTRFFLFPLTIKAEEQRDILVRVRVAGMNRSVLNSISLRPESTYLFQNQTTELITWLNYGAMALLTLLSVIAAVVLKNRTFAYFALFVTGATLVQFTLKGYALIYLWPDNSWLRNHGFILFTAIMSLSFIRFSQEFLDLKNLAPRINVICHFFIWCILIILISILLLSSVYLYAGIFLMILSYTLSVFTIIFSGIWLWQQGNSLARQFTLAWFSFAFVIIYGMINTYFYSRMDFISWDAINMAILVLSLVLFMAMIQKLRQGQLEKNHAIAESKAKSEFLAKMSHEIRTPMNGVLGMAELLSDTKLNNTQRYYTDVIYNSGRTLLSVINEILDYSKIAAGKMQLENNIFNICHLGQECVSLFTAQAREKKLELICRIDPKMPRIWNGDETRIRQIVINLLGNAFKFTEAGEILLNIEPLADAKGVHIAVKDTGIGITEEQQTKLFEDFSQADASISRKYGGTGLGLTISKQLTEMMGGQIGFDSHYGIGSTFWFTVPLQSVTETLEPVDHLSLSNCKLLLVDDNKSYCDVVKEQLLMHGMQVDDAENGMVALEMIDKAEEEQKPYDLISIDLDMPVMNGIELAKTLKSRASKHTYTNILLSATSHLPTTEEYRNWDIALAAQKPILADELYSLFVKALGKHITNTDADTQSTTVTDEMTSQHSAVNLHLLVAEDNDVNYQVAAAMLRKLGHRVQRAENGLLALTHFKSHNLNARSESFDLIFMDCEMPEMDGFVSTQAIRQLENERHMPAIPIVALTAHTSEDRIALCSDSGMDSYLSKPIEGNALQKTIQTYFSH